VPTYDYHCLKCDGTFEVFHSMSADPVKTCEKCGGKVERLIGAGSGLIFKGTGFYATDYKKTPPNETKKSETKKETSSTPKSTSSTSKEQQSGGSKNES